MKWNWLHELPEEERRHLEGLASYVFTHMRDELNELDYEAQEKLEDDVAHDEYGENFLRAVQAGKTPDKMLFADFEKSMKWRCMRACRRIIGLLRYIEEYPVPEDKAVEINQAYELGYKCATLDMASFVLEHVKELKTAFRSAKFSDERKDQESDERKRKAEMEESALDEAKRIKKEEPHRDRTGIWEELKPKYKGEVPSLDKLRTRIMKEVPK